MDPARLCRQHLLGEHVELHMLARTLELGRSIEGFVTGGLVDTRQIGSRHADLVAEMERRGYRHASPLAQPDCEGRGQVDVAANEHELARRCAACRERRKR